jgi:hypothetical protein
MAAAPFLYAVEAGFEFGSIKTDGGHAFAGGESRIVPILMVP